MASRLDRSVPDVKARASRRDRRGSLFIFAVFAAVALVVTASFLAFSLLPTPAPPPGNLTFASPHLEHGNVSLAVLNTTGGPYPYTAFRLHLIVNDFSSPVIGLAPNATVMQLVVGPNAYRITWNDSNRDGAVSVGDSFLVSGDGSPLPSLSSYEFDLQGQAAWTAKAFWATE